MTLCIGPWVLKFFLCVNNMIFLHIHEESLVRTLEDFPAVRWMRWKWLIWAIFQKTHRLRRRASLASCSLAPERNFWKWMMDFLTFPNQISEACSPGHSRHLIHKSAQIVWKCSRSQKREILYIVIFSVLYLTLLHLCPSDSTVSEDAGI